MNPELQNITDRIARESQSLERLRMEIGKVIVGQTRLIDGMLMALLTGGHILLEGVPGLAKTTAVRCLAQALGLGFQRISFTPDLLPADVIGTLVFDPRNATFTPRKGPVFTHLLLADEINRAPAKVQSALLEAMQERQVTLGDQSYPLPDPFLVMATQNPIEHEGTYPLPEAQVDRFMFKCRLDYPTREEERRIIDRFSRRTTIPIEPVMDIHQLTGLRQLIDSVYCDEKVSEYILDLVFATRTPSDFGIPLQAQIEMGASPRASLYLQLAARAQALLQGRAFTTPQDVKAVAHDVLRHRILLSYEAEAEEMTAEHVIDTILNAIPVP